MSEIEVKIMGIDKDEIREKLTGIGARLVKKEMQTNHIYDFPGDILKRDHKGYCRIREVDNLIDGSKKYILTVKKLKSAEKYKEMLEEETEVADFDAAHNILIELGLYKMFKSNKFRESYELNGALYEIDECDKDVYPHPYMEVEARDEEALIKAVELIGYRMEDTSAKSIEELRKELEKK